jgi:hypothetical protein
MAMHVYYIEEVLTRNNRVFSCHHILSIWYNMNRWTAHRIKQSLYCCTYLLLENMFTEPLYSIWGRGA